MRRTTIVVVLAATVATVATACQPSLDEQAADALGPEVGDPGPTHRPGQPCLVCHGTGDQRGVAIFAVAGTIYERAGDPRGLRNAEVVISDAEERTFLVHSNEAGNFMISVDEDLDLPRETPDGELQVPEAPIYPLRVSVRRGADEQIMRSAIHREGSCAACHSDPAGVASAGPVFVVAP